MISRIEAILVYCDGIIENLGKVVDLGRMRFDSRRTGAFHSGMETCEMLHVKDFAMIRRLFRRPCIG